MLVFPSFDCCLFGPNIHQHHRKQTASLFKDSPIIIIHDYSTLQLSNSFNLEVNYLLFILFCESKNGKCLTPQFLKVKPRWGWGSIWSRGAELFIGSSHVVGIKQIALTVKRKVKPCPELLAEVHLFNWLVPDWHWSSMLGFSLTSSSVFIVKTAARAN